MDGLSRSTRRDTAHSLPISIGHAGASRVTRRIARPIETRISLESRNVCWSTDGLFIHGHRTVPRPATLRGVVGACRARKQIACTEQLFSREDQEMHECTKECN